MISITNVVFLTLALIIFAFLCQKFYLRSLKKLAEGNSNKSKMILFFVFLIVFLLAFNFGNRLIMWLFFSDHSK